MITSAQRALAIALAERDAYVQSVAIYYLGQGHHARGDYRRAIEFMRRFIGRIPDDRIAERFGMAGTPALTNRANLCQCLAELGEFAVAGAAAKPSAYSK